MVRFVFLALLVANLLFLAWAQWIDAPQDTAAVESTARLPKLQLSTEKPAQPSTDNSALRDPPSADAVSKGDGTLTPAAAAKVALASPVSKDAQQSCTSIGPFPDIPSAAKAAGVLSQRGFSFQQRAEEGDTIEGFWVYVGGLDSDDEVAKVVDRLGKAGFPDAHVMKNYSTNRRVSVGLFSKRERAERRAAAVKNMNLQPEIVERKFPGTVYWVDVTQPVQLGVKKRTLPAEYNFVDVGSTKIGMQPCPQPIRPAEPLQAAPDDVDGVTKGLPRTTVASAPTQTH